MQWDYAKNERWQLPGVKAKHGVHAHQLADYLGLTGDAVDNIPGVPGHRPENSRHPAQPFRHTWMRLMEKLDEVPYLRLRSAAHARQPSLREYIATWRC